MQQKKQLLGAHMSIAGGIDQAYYRAASIGCTTFQFFTHSNRQWQMKPLSEETVQAAKAAQEATGITQSMVHASYLIALGSSTPETVQKSKETIVKELSHCDALRVPFLVMHPGGGQADPDACIQQIGEGLSEVLDKSGGKTQILLEIMAGQGTQVGRTLEQLAQLRKVTSHSKRVGFCIDTCHLWAAGYDFSTEANYHKVWKEIDDILGLENVKALHLNDSKQGCGSRVDRHADIGKGTIGLEAFKLIMHDPRLTSIPKVLETPSDELKDYAQYIELLLSL